MCTVLQQHLNQTNGFMELERTTSPRPTTGTGGTSSNASTTLYRHVSPGRSTLVSSQPTYSYLQDLPNLKRPIDPYDRKISTPTMHFHVPTDSEGKAGRMSRSSYVQQLLGRRSRSQSRTGMRVLVDQIQSTTPR